MPYGNNPYLPRLRAKVVDLVKFEGKSIREAARMIGVEASTVSRWVRRAGEGGSFKIATLSSRPHYHPDKLSEEAVKKIIDCRLKNNGKCSEVIQQILHNEGIEVSLSSIKRTLARAGLLKQKSKWKRYHQSGERPMILHPGDLVELDTVHIFQPLTARIYLYTLLDVYSRWAFALATEKINTIKSVEFVKKAKQKAPFKFICLQSDHGSEFSKQFSERIQIRHRHSRVRKPNDNAHLERFNRTIQEEFLRHLKSLEIPEINAALPEYLNYYNSKRPHLGINLKTPCQLLRSY